MHVTGLELKYRTYIKQALKKLYFAILTEEGTIKQRILFSSAAQSVQLFQTP